MSSRVTSAVAHGDLDGDGSADIVVGVESSPTILLRNQGTGRSWVTVRALGTEGNRSAIGARVEVIAEGFRQVRELHAGSSFYSSETPWPTFGLGDREGLVGVRVTWPSGTTESFPGIGVRQLVTVTEGDGLSVAP
ncbi:MAG: ASPIC/UnbV domain-containing protein [Candidatus Binatia bacterium]